MSSHRPTDIEGKVHQFWNSGGKWILAGIVIALIGWGASGVLKANELEREAEAFSALYGIEKIYLERKSNFELGEMLKTQKPDELGLPPEAVKDSKVKSGDLETDFGDVLSDLKAFLTQHPDTQAAAMAGLWMMDLYSSYDQWEPAGAALSEIAGQSQSDSLISGLLEMGTATALAEAGKCQEAIQHWNTILNNKTMTYLHGEAALRSGLCLEKTGAFEEAAAKYRLASEKAASGSSVASTADQFLRALEIAPPSANKEPM